MLKVFICEDNPLHLAGLEKLIRDYIAENEFSISIATCANHPDKILHELNKNYNQTGLYFLDIDFDSKLNGFDLAVKIRQLDPRAFIVIVTSDSELQMLTFKHIVEAMDYIVKGSKGFEERIKACIKCAYERYMFITATTHIEIKLATEIKRKTAEGTISLSKGSIVKLLNTDILYVKSFYDNSRKLTIYTLSGEYITRLSLKDMEIRLGNNFARCEVSCLVNIAKANTLDRKNMKLHIDDNKTVDVSRSYLKKWQELLASDSANAK